MRTMSSKYKLLSFLIIIIYLGGSNYVIAQDDYIKPNILHQVVEKTYEGQDLIIEAVITDNIAVEEVTLFYRTIGEPTFQYIPMYLEFNVFHAEIPPEDITTAGIEYYIQAEDFEENRAYSPPVDPEYYPHQVTYVSFSETSAPDAILLQPESGAVEESGHQIVILSLYDEEEDIDLSTAILLVDGIDITADATLSEDLITYIPIRDFEIGTHTIEFSIKDLIGNESPQYQWSFSIQKVEVKRPFLADAKIKGVIDLESEYDKYAGKAQPENRPVDIQRPRIKMSLIQDWFKASFSLALYQHFDTFARDIDARRQPLDRFRFAIETPYGSLKGGDSNPYFSELTLEGTRIRGAVADFKYKGMNSTIVYGSTKAMIPGITTVDTSGQSQYNKGTFNRKIWGVNTNYNYRQIFEFGLNYVQLYDDTTSLSDEQYGDFSGIPDSFKVKYKASHNRVAGINSRLKLFDNKTEITAYWAASVLTDDIIDPDSRKTKVTTYDSEKSFLKNLSDGTYWIELNSRQKYVNVKGVYKRIPRIFSSLANPTILPDIQGLKLDGRTTNQWNNQITLGLGYENTHDNLDQEETQTITNSTYSGIMNLNFSGLPTVSLGYRVLQRQGEATIEDTTGLKLSDDKTSTITIGPAYSFKLKNIDVGLSGNIMLMDFEDKSNPGANFNNNSYMVAITQAFPMALTVNFGFGISENIPVIKEEKTTFILANWKVAYTLKNKKVKVYLGSNIVNGDKKDEIDNRKVTINFGGQYKLSKNQFFGFDIGLWSVKDFMDDSKSYSETRAKLKYKYSF